MMTAGDLDAVLRTIEDWEPDVAAIVVTDASACLGSHGPIDQVLPLASVSKPIAAVGVLIAAQHGLLHLDEPTPPSDVADVTVRHLLAHAGGLPLDPGGILNRAEYRRVYSNWAFDLLGELVAQRCGTPFAEFLRVEVFEPLKMDQTTLDGSPARDGRGTVRDLARLARELIDPHLIDRDLLDEATAVAFPGLTGVLPGFGRQQPNDWGLGFEIKDGKSPHWTGDQLSPQTFGHFGQSGSFIWVDPTRGLGCASLANQAFGPWAKQHWPQIHDEIVQVFDARLAQQ